MKNFILLILFQCAWFLCVLTPSMSTDYAGVFAMLLYLAIVLRFIEAKLSAFFLIALAGSIGGSVDGILTYAGWYAFPNKEPWTPIYLYAIWFGFAATLATSLSWLKSRYALASLLGAIFGPLNYLAGERLGAVSFPNGVDKTMIMLAFLWSLELPLLLWIINSSFLTSLKQKPLSNKLLISSYLKKIFAKQN